MPAKHIRPKEAFIIPPGGTTPGERSEGMLWAELTDSPRFQRALQVALTEYVMRQNTSTIADAANMALRIEGAKAVLHILLNLGDPEKPGSGGVGVKAGLEPV